MLFLKQQRKFPRKLEVNEPCQRISLLSQAVASAIIYSDNDENVLGGVLAGDGNTFRDKFMLPENWQGAWKSSPHATSSPSSRIVHSI